MLGLHGLAASLRSSASSPQKMLTSIQVCVTLSPGDFESKLEQALFESSVWAGSLIFPTNVAPQGFGVQVGGLW